MNNLMNSKKSTIILPAYFILALLTALTNINTASAQTSSPSAYWSIMSYAKNITGGSSSTSYIFANPGDEIEFETRVYVRSTISGMVVKNILPSQMTYVNGSLTINGVAAGNDILNVNLGSVTEKMVYIKLKAKLSGVSSFPDTRTVLNYKAESSYNSITRSDTALVQVNNVPKNPEPVAGSAWSMIAKAKNVTNTSYYSSYIFAEPGDEIEFETKIFVNGTVNGIIVKNSLPSQLTYVSGSLKLDGNFSGNDISNVNLGNRSNTSATVSLRARIASSSFFTNPKTVLTLTAESLQGAKKLTDTAMVQVGSGGEGLTNGLTVTKYAKNLSAQQAQSGMITVREGDVIEYKIEVRNNGNTAHQNVIVYDSLPNKLSYVTGSFKLNNNLTNPQNFFGSGLNIGTIEAYSLKTIIYQAKVLTGANGTTLANQVGVRADGVLVKTDISKAVVNNSYVPSGNSGAVSGTNIDLVLSKRAQNFTQNADASKVVAQPGDQIVYTLVVENKGSAPAGNFVIEDSVADLLEYADFVEVSGATYYSSDKTLRWPAASIPAGQKIEKSFAVKIKDTLPKTGDFVISNTFGNTVKISLKKSAYTAPTSGPNAMLSTFLALLSVIGVALWKNRNNAWFRKFSLKTKGDLVQ
jgi:uncharacterized repeat protein (TIGR01451 family)